MNFQQFKFAGSPDITGLGRNGHFQATGIQVQAVFDAVWIQNLTSRGQPARGRVSLPKCPDEVRKMADALHVIANTIEAESE